MMLSLLPASALADGPNYTSITNYEELKAIENETGVFYFIPAEDFDWPEEATEVSITAELRMIGTWVIPEQATVNLSGKIQPDRGTAYACLTVNGTLSLVNGMSLSVSRIEIAGTLIADYGVSIYADEGELLSTGTIRAVSSTNSYRLSFSRGPGYLYHPSTMDYPAHWVFHEGAQFFGRETGSAAGELIFTGLLETVGAVRCPFMLTQYTETENVLRGDWILGGIKVQGNAQLLIDGNVSTRYLNLWAQSENTCARVTVLEGSTFALEQWADQPNYGASSDSTGTTEILVNGTMHLGEQTMNNGALKITGNGMTVISKAAKITVEGSFAITAQPQDYTGAVGGVATFTVKATGAGLTYKWQYSDNNGGKWTDSASNTSATTTCKITAARDGRLYRCIVTDANGNSLTTNTAKLIVR